MSTGANPRKDRCKLLESRLRVESWAILSLRLRVRVRGRRLDWSKPSCRHPPGNPQIEICGPLRGNLGEHARRRGPLLPRLHTAAEHQFGSVMESCDHAAVVDGELLSPAPQQIWRL